MKRSQCPSQEQIARFGSGLLDSLSDEAVLSHLETCPACESAVQGLEQSPEGLLTQLQAPPIQDQFLDEIPERVPFSLENAAPSASAPQLAPVSAPVSKSPARRTGSKRSDKSKDLKQRSPNDRSAPPNVSAPRKLWKYALPIAGAGIVALVAAIPFLDRQEDDQATSPKQSPPSTQLATGGNEPQNPGAGSPGRTLQDARIPDGFQMGKLSGSEPIRSIRVKLEVAEDGDPLAEPVHLHLGLGFPLRLFPIGTLDRSPQFAAFPQQSSLSQDSVSVAPGESVWFQFDVAPEQDGFDELHTTSTLLEDVPIEKISMVGFASRGETDWILDGYEIQVNGQLFASHGNLQAKIGERGEEVRILLEEAVPVIRELEETVNLLQKYVDTNLASEEDIVKLAESQSQLTNSSDSTIPLAGELAGTHPWFVETSPEFLTTHRSMTDPVDELTVKLLPAFEEQSDTSNLLYVKLGDRRFPLTSEMQPLTQEPTLQEFVIRPLQPVEKADLAALAVGVLGSNARFNRVPDRAGLQRVVVHADGQDYYDSETQSVDRTNLGLFRLIPPVHRDEDSLIVMNTPGLNETFLWKSGMTATPLSSDSPVSAAPKEPPSGNTPSFPSLTPLAHIGWCGTERMPLVNLEEPDSPEIQPNLNGVPDDPSVGGKPVQGLSDPLSGEDPNQRAGGGLPSSLLQGGLATTGIGPGTGTGSGVQPLTPVTYGGGGPGATAFQPQGGPVENLLSKLIENLLNQRTKSRTAAARKAKKSQPAWNQTNSPNQLNSGQQNGQNQTPSSTPKAVTLPQQNQPSITDVRIHAPRGTVVDGSPISVDWQTSGNTSEISRFKVELHAIVAHDQRWFIGTPLAVKDDARRSGVSLTPSLDKISPLLKDPSEVDLLYVRPKVRAYDSNDTPIGDGAFGPLLPIAGQSFDPKLFLTLETQFSAMSTNSVNFGKEILVRPPAPSPLTDTEVWTFDRQEQSHSGLSFDLIRKTGKGYPAQSIAIRPSKESELITIKLNAKNVDLQEDMRLVGHIGFINADRSPLQAIVQSRIIVSDATKSASAGTAPPLLQIETDPDHPIQVSKMSKDGNFPSPLQVLDIPLLLSLDQAQYEDKIEDSPQQILAMSNSSGLMPGNVDIAVTFMLNMPELSKNLNVTSAIPEAIGLFDLRLVPSNIPRKPQTIAVPFPIAKTPIPTTTPTITTPQQFLPTVLNPPPDPGNEQASFLEAHNVERRLVGVADLKWSDDLAAHAQKWADELARRYANNSATKLKHRSYLFANSQPIPLEQTPYGENLYYTSSDTHWSPAAAARVWLQEKDAFLNKTPRKQIGHYTQAVWGTTTHVGYGIAKVNGQVWFVASYNPPGNSYPNKPYPSAPHALPNMDSNGNPIW